MTVTLRAPSLDECQLVRVWRNAPDVLPMLRTGAKTEAEQAAFFRDVICNPRADHRYYAVVGGRELLGMGGLTYLSRVTGEAEISLLLDPAWRGKGVGTAAVLALLEQACHLHLTSVIGECYAQSPAQPFWRKVVERTGGDVIERAGDSFWFRWRIWR